MKKRLLITTITIAMVVATLVGCNSDKNKKENNTSTPSEAPQSVEKTPDLPADNSINPENAQYWREVLQKYRFNENVNQILLVRYTGGCNAIAKFYIKSDYNNVWQLEFESTAYVGKYAIGKTGEGDAKTPTGDFGIQKAFGILPDPGTSLEYLDVTETTFACDENGNYYNQIIDTEETGHNCKGEEMFKYSPEYNYGIQTDYNSENTYPNGSAIFIHCKGEKAFTGGCIALDQDDVETILLYADDGMRVVVGND